MEDDYRVNAFYIKKDHVGIGIFPLQRDYYILFEDKLFWEKYKKIMYFYKHCEEEIIETNILFDREIFSIFSEPKINEECVNNLTIKDYIDFSNDIKLISAKIKYLFAYLDDIYVDFERIEGRYKYPVKDPCYYYYTIKLSEAFITEEEALVVIDIKSKIILSVKYPFDKAELNNFEIKERLVQKLPEVVKKVSSIKLPEYKLLKSIENINLNDYTICFNIYSDKIQYYFESARFWSMTLSQMYLPNEEDFPKLDFSENRVKDFLYKFEVSVKDLCQTMRYLIDIDEFEKAKAFLPSFYYDFPNKEFISFFRVTDNFVNSILPGWIGTHKPFFDSIPDELKYWVVNGKDWSKEFF